MRCLISCEHASNLVPQDFFHLFSGNENLLQSHRAYDRGAEGLARRLANELGIKVYLGTITRLLIDLNRSPHNRHTLFSDFSRKLYKSEQSLLVDRYYQPFRTKVMQQLAAWNCDGQPVLHISVHSFTPVLHGRIREADIGLLYDPSRRTEREMCSYIARFLKKNTSLRVRKNYPYRGTSDGFTSFLRKKYSQQQYVGIELEVNENFLLAGDKKALESEEMLLYAINNILLSEVFFQARSNRHT